MIRMTEFDMTGTPQEGDLRVWYIPQLPSKPFIFPVPDIDTALIVSDAIVGLSIHEFENNIKPDYSDALGIERFEDGVWCELDEEEWHD